MVNSGRVNTLSHDIPTFNKTPRSANCARSYNPTTRVMNDNETRHDIPNHPPTVGDKRARGQFQVTLENARLKKLLADAMLDNAALKNLLAKKW
jgi:hypothetical protein